MTAEWRTGEARRDAIIAKFTEWLDATLADEPPPAGIDAELIALVEDARLTEVPEACSEYEVWSTLTALAQEVKLQGRAFQGLTDTVKPLQASMDAIAAVEASSEEMERTLRSEVEAAVWREVVDLFLDIRDRLVRSGAGLDDTVAQLRDSGVNHRLLQWLPGLRGVFSGAAESVGALEQGNTLLRERVDEALREIDVQEIAAAGLPFDANTMKAIDVEVRDDMPEGTVSSVHRTGYFWRGKVYRLAEVAVTRRAAKELEAHE